MIPCPSDCRVLVVANNTEVLRAVTTLFSRFGYPVSAAGNSVTALDLIGKRHFDLMVSDFNLPLANGYELACRIKQANPRTRVVIMTGGGISQAADYSDCREIDDWLFKPFDIEALSNVITVLGLPDAFHADTPAQKADPVSVFTHDVLRQPGNYSPHGPAWPHRNPNIKKPALTVN